MDKGIKVDYKIRSIFLLHDIGEIINKNIQLYLKISNYKLIKD